MAETKAWLLSLDETKKVAIGYHHIIEYVDIAECTLIPTPLSFGYAANLMIRHDELVPIVDLGKFFNPKLKAGNNVTGIIMVNYQEAPEQPLKKGGIILRGFPKEITVNSDMGCLLPDSEKDWRAMAEACFEYDAHATPVIKVEKIFGATLKPLFHTRLKSMSAKDSNKSKKKAVAQ